MSTLLVSNKYNLVTEQNLTNAYANFGTEIDTKAYNKIGVFVTSDVNDSTGIILKAVGKHTVAGDEFEISGLSTVSIPAADAKTYFEFEVGAIPILQLKAIATVVGATAGDLTIDITKSE